MNKKIALFLLGIFALASTAWADDPDLQGRITTIDTSKSIITVRNELDNKIGKREYRVLVKQGMISNYMINDELKVWLMADHKEARMIKRVDRGENKEKPKA